MKMKKARYVLSADIGVGSLKLALFGTDRSGRTALFKASARDVPASGPAGEFLKDCIREFLPERQKPKEAHIVLSAPFVEIGRVDIPQMPAKEIQEAVKWKIKDKMPFDMGEGVVDYCAAGSYVREGGVKELVILAAAAREADIKNIVFQLRDLGLRAAGVSASPFCLGRILPKDAGQDVSAVVDIGAGHTYVSVYEKCRPVFVRNIPVSSSQITKAMCGVLVSDKGRIELSENDAEYIKMRYGVPLSVSGILERNVTGAQIMGMIRPILEQLVMEIRRTFTYYVNELKGAEPSVIYLAGGGAMLKGLGSVLGNELGISVKYLGMPSSIVNNTPQDAVSLLPFLGAAGAVLPPVSGSINLIPPDLAEEKAEAIEKGSLRVAGFTVLCILLFSYMGLAIRTADYKRRIKTCVMNRKIFNEVLSLRDKLVQWNRTVMAADSKKVRYNMLLREVSNIVPANIVFEEMFIDAGKGRVVFKGIIYPAAGIVEAELTEFMERIEESAFFEEANLVSVAKNIEVKRPYAVFEIRCSIY